MSSIICFTFFWVVDFIELDAVSPIVTAGFSVEKSVIVAMSISHEFGDIRFTARVDFVEIITISPIVIASWSIVHAVIIT